MSGQPENVSSEVQTRSSLVDYRNKNLELTGKSWECTKDKVVIIVVVLLLLYYYAMSSNSCIDPTQPSCYEGYSGTFRNTYNKLLSN